MGNTIFMATETIMNFLDVILGLILLGAFFSGLKKGFIQTFASIVGLVVGVYAALYFSDFVGGYLSNWFDFSEQTTKWAAFIITFFGVLFFANFVGKLLTKFIDIVLLGFLNKLLGGVFAVLKYAFILSIFFLFFNSNNFTGLMVSEEQKNESLLYGYIAPFAPSVLPSIVEQFDSIRMPEEDTQNSESEESDRPIE